VGGLGVGLGVEGLGVRGWGRDRGTGRDTCRGRGGGRGGVGQG